MLEPTSREARQLPLIYAIIDSTVAINPIIINIIIGLLVIWRLVE